MSSTIELNAGWLHPLTLQFVEIMEFTHDIIRVSVPSDLEGLSNGLNIIELAGYKNTDRKITMSL